MMAMDLRRLLMTSGLMALLVAACAEGIPTPPLPADDDDVGGGGNGGGAGHQGGGSSEDCLDGTDNDGNDLIDCEDPACQPGHTCVPEAPAEWQGLFQLATTSFSNGAPACGDGSKPQSYFHGTGDDASCTDCNCGSLQGVSCALPQMSCWGNSSGCYLSADFVTSVSDTACYEFDAAFLCSSACGSPHACKRTTAATITGTPTCSASGGTPSLPAMWQYQNSLCLLEGAGAGCDSGEVCVPVGEVPYDQLACVLQESPAECPAGFPDAIQAYTGGVDTRSCSACTCEPDGVGCGSGSFTVYDDSACGSGGAGPVGISGSQCHSVTPQVDSQTGSYRATAGTVSGGCNPTGGQPTGEVTPTGPVTICCAL